MNSEGTTGLLKSGYRELGYSLEDDEDFLILRKNGIQVAAWSTHGVTAEKLQQDIERIVSLYSGASHEC